MSAEEREASITVGHDGAWLSDEEILAKICDRPDCFSILVKKYSEALQRRGFFILQNHEEVEDTMQETFVLVYKSLPRFRLQGNATMKSWIYKIFINRCFSRLKKIRQQKKLCETWMQEQLVHHERFSPTSSQEERRELLLRGIDQLPPRLRQTITLCFFDQTPQKIVAQRIGIQTGALRARIHRAKKVLRELCK